MTLALNKIHLGDCLVLMSSITEGSIDMIFTDPPYGHNNNSNGDLIARREVALGIGDYDPAVNDRSIANDGPEADEVFRNALRHFTRLLKPGGCCCCCCGGGGGPNPQFARWSLWLDEVLQYKQMVVWDKGRFGMGWHYRRSYETILVAQKPGAACAWYDNSRRVENIIRPGQGIKKIVPTSEQHPTEKPVELAAHFIKLHTRPGDVVLDPFVGSGSTIEACIMTGRQWLGIEKDPEYYQMAMERVAKRLQQPFLPGIVEEPQPRPEQAALL